MTLLNLLVWISVASAALLLAQRRVYGGIALAAGAVLALMDYGVVTLDIKILPLAPVLSGILAAIGLYTYLSVKDKASVTAATLLAASSALYFLHITGAL